MSKLTVLIVDDIEMNREFLKKLLEDKYEVIEASNGVEAMSQIESTIIDIVITDIFMEPMNGYELIRNIRSKDEYKKIPIIAVTESDRASRKMALKSGADDLIYRPFIASILHNRINGLLFDGFDLNRYKIAFENNPISFMLYHVIDRPDTPSYKIMYLNKAARNDFSPPFIEDLLWTDENPEHCEFLLKALRTGEVQHNTFYDNVLNKWLDWTIYLDGNGLIAAMVHDISNSIEEQTESANQQKEEAIRKRDELSSIIKNIPSGILVFKITANGLSVVMGNEPGFKLLSIDPIKSLNASEDKILTYVYQDDRKIILDNVQSIKDNLEKTFDYEVRLFNKQVNDYVWFSAQSRGLIDKDNDIYIFTSYRDITAQKKLQATEMELLSVKKANIEKSRFLSQMSHDMRTPMNGILGLIHLMKDENDIKQIKANIAQMELSSNYLLNLMNDTLDITRIEAGKLELHEKPTNSIEIIQNILGNAQLMASSKHLQLKIKIPPIESNEWKAIIVDSSRLQQVIINIVSNAVKYTPENGYVDISMETLSLEDGVLTDRYVIKDSGIGISKEFLEHIYEPYSQEGRMYTSFQNGSGLGMNIVKQLVDLMGGEISIKSTVNVGTEVILIMHYKVYDGKLESNKNKTIDILKNKRVLLCEDHPLNAEIASKILELAGMKVDQANNGAIGLQMFEVNNPNYYDIILMDIRMPIMNGLEATKQIRKCNKEDAKDIPIIALTANVIDGDIETCLLAGMNDHLSKPIDTEKLYETLSKYL